MSQLIVGIAVDVDELKRVKQLCLGEMERVTVAGGVSGAQHGEGAESVRVEEGGGVGNTLSGGGDGERSAFGGRRKAHGRGRCIGRIIHVCGGEV